MTTLFDIQKLHNHTEKLAGEPAGSGSSPVQGQDGLPGTSRPPANEGTTSTPSPGGDGERQVMIAEANSPSRSHAATARPPSILVVDDEPLIRDLLSRYLELQGFRVLVAESGREAVQRYLNERGVGLVLLDVRMPGGLDGPATLAALRYLDPQVRCCFMSGDLGTYTAEEIVRSGALALFQKPLQLSELATSLRRLLASPARPNS